MKTAILFIIPVLLILAGRELTAQSRHDSLSRIANEASHDISGTVMSEDGNWLTTRKRSRMPVREIGDMDKDTIILFDLRDPVRHSITGYRQNVWKVAFVDNHHLLLQYERQTELLDLSKQSSIFYKGVKSIQSLNDHGNFLLHYNQEHNNKIELRNNRGDLINAANHVTRFYPTGNNHIYTITDNGENRYEILRFKGESTEKVYETTRKIVSLVTVPGEQGIIICEQVTENDWQEIVYLDLSNKITYPLKEILPLNFQKGSIEIIPESSSYFLKLRMPRKKGSDSPVDIWYGNEKGLRQKFFPNRDSCFVWEPEKRRVQRIGNNQLTKNANIGSNRYFLSLDPSYFQDYPQPPRYKVNVYDRQKDCYTLMDTTSRNLYTSPDGRNVLYKKNEAWSLYHIPTGTKRTISNSKLNTPYFVTGTDTVLFEGEGGLLRYNLTEKEESVQLGSFEGCQVTILNGSSRNTLPGLNFFEKIIMAEQALLLKLYNYQKNTSTYVLWQSGRQDTVIAPTGKRIENLDYNSTYNRFSYTEEDYNHPPRLVYKEMGKKKRVIYQSNKADKAVLSLKQEIVSYTNSDSIPMKGVLYYPANYNPSLKYPMVVHIYQKQRSLSNLYPYPFYYNGLGFNIRLLIEKGYFVYLPDIVIQGKDGPGMDALDCVNHALDALDGNPLIDKNKIGLTGHSFGGYETDFIATRSNRFAAYVSGSGHSDINWAANAFNYNFLFPDYVRIEANMYKLGVAFWENKALYLANNPIYQADKVNAPVLLWSGLEDQNVTSDHSMAFYNALRRNKKDVVALFYEGEGHSLIKPRAQFDLTSRILDWFDYFMKGNTDIEWINKRLN
ncbi:alpha/beta hydrolase family protein [Draconibacterium mangrovi]|uniref:alpha/beta hydrolase family protein n=1 Tax=Draconibacterium mangrovi TaxID=2697469 RepID=UPI0013D48DCA|nr:prolyl oligopeptidase family serine peptidase [Draconibacterium mangrovi]